MGNRIEKTMKEYQIALAKSEAKYRQIIENIADVVWTSDMDLRTTYVSPSVEKMFGESPEVYMEKTAEECFTPDSLKKIHEVVFEELEKEKDQKNDKSRTRQLEVEHYRVDGSTIWISLHMSFLRDENRKVIGFQGMSRDITERKQAEQDLYKCEQRFRVAQEISPDGFTILHPIRNETGEIIDFIFIYENPAVARINQTDPQKVVGKRLLDLFPTHRGTSILEAYIHVANTGNSQVLEDVNAGEVLSKQTWLRLVIVSMSEDIAILTQDVTVRKKNEYEIKQSEEKFQLLFNKAPLGYQSLDFDGCFIDVNQQWLDTLGFTREEVIGKWFGDFLCPEYVDSFRQRFPIFKSQGQIHSEFEMQTKDGRQLFIAFEGKIGYGDDGTFKQAHCILQDITNQRKAEKALIESEERYKSLFDNSGVGIGYYTPEGVIISYNQIALKNMGGKIEDYVGKPINDIFPKAEADKFLSRIKKAASFDQPQEYEDYLVLNSTHKWFSSTFTSVTNRTGEVIGVLIASLDITDRKQAEETLSESHALLNEAFENSQVGIMIAGAPDGMLRFVNKAGLLIKDKSEEELVKNIDIQSYVDNWKILHLDGTPYAANKVPMARAVLYGETISEELIIRRDNNGDRIVLANAAPIKDSDNKIKAGVVVLLDITERKKIDGQLKQNWNDLMESQRIAHVGTWRLELATNQVVMSNELYRMYGLDPTTPPPSYTEHMKLFTPESWDKLSTAIENTTIFGTPYELELETIKTDGMNGWMWVRGEANRDLQGNVISLWGAAQDISERRKNELALEEKHILLKSILDSIPDLIFYKDTEFRYIGCNQALERYIGKKEEEIVGLTDFDIFDRDLANSFREMDLVMMRQKSQRRNDEQITYPDGEKVILETLKTPYYNMSGNILGLIGISRDITERKQKEEKINYLNLHDPLTGLYNRSFFEAEMKRLDHERQLPLSTIVGDINGLKLINDAFGHAEGDNLLVVISKILRSNCRGEDIIARTGGDEFYILLPNTDASQANAICERIKRACEESVTIIDGAIGFSSISLGYATKTEMSVSFLSVMKNAEEYMYRKKLLESKSLHSAIISSINTTLFEKSCETAEHADRMTRLSKKLGVILDLSIDDMVSLELVSRLHDIGKISIDRSILTKAGKLSEEEWDEIKKHPGAGYRIAQTVPELKAISLYILCHHERWDGNGYPQGLRGEDIPLLSRILALVDSYDAMSQDRSYRKAMPKEGVIAEIVRNSGTQFDPQLVKIFIEKVIADEI